MFFFDIIIFGWYWLLKHSVYLTSDNDSFGSKEHAMAISVIINGITIYNIISFISFRGFHYQINKWLIVGVTLLMLFGGYYAYIKKDRMVVLFSKTKIWKCISVIITVIYSVLTCYIMIVIGNMINQSLSTLR